MNDFPNDFNNRNLPAESDSKANTLTIAASALFAALIIALVMFAPGNKEGSQVAINDTGNGAVTTPGNAYNRTPPGQTTGAGSPSRPATQAPAAP